MLHASCQIRNVQLPARSSRSPKVPAGSCLGLTIGTSSWFGLEDAGGAYRRTFLLVSRCVLCSLREWVKVDIERTGTVTIVSAMNNFFSQCKTRLPGKCPPVLMAVTPGNTSSVVPAGPSIKCKACGVGGFWQSHS